MANDEDSVRLRELAEALDCLTEADLQLLADYTDITIQAKRKRGKSPPFLRFGNRIFYPREGVRAYLHALVKEPAQTHIKDAL
jgi:hypothetical protein